VETKYVAQGLLDCNRSTLRGKLRAVRQKIFTDQDKDRNSYSMEGFRLIQLNHSGGIIDSTSAEVLSPSAPKGGARQDPDSPEASEGAVEGAGVKDPVTLALPGP
jgi:hypothetical protein